jgi:hypothetical protein
MESDKGNMAAIYEANGCIRFVLPDAGNRSRSCPTERVRVSVYFWVFRLSWESSKYGAMNDLPSNHPPLGKIDIKPAGFQP